MPSLAPSIRPHLLPTPALTPGPPFPPICYPLAQLKLLTSSFLLQEDLLELLDDMALGPLPDEGSSDLPIASDPSQLPLSPIVNNFPNPAPQENPLRQLLAEERECLLWGRKGCSRDCGPYLVLFISPLPSSSTPVLRVGVRGDCLLPRPPGLPADTLLPRGPAAGGQHI